MVVVHVLTNERMRLHCSIRVHFWHVDVVDKVDQFLGPWRSVVAARLLLKWPLKHG